MQLGAVVRITRDYRPQYPDPIQARAGARVKVGQADPEFPGWRWCTAADGRSGWVPEELLQHSGDGDTLVVDYSAVELAVSAGEEVRIIDARHAWLRVQNSAGDIGWIPASHTNVH